MIISVDDVDLDESLVVASMLLFFGGVPKPPIVAGFSITVVVVNSTLGLFVGGSLMMMMIHR